MGGNRAMRATGRAIVATVALYALVLASFVSGFVPAAGPVDLAGAAICHPGGEGRDGASPDRGGGTPPAKAGAHLCCTAACLGGPFPGPALALALPAWPSSPAAGLAGPTHPADISPSRQRMLPAAPPRGPPSA